MKKTRFSVITAPYSAKESSIIHPTRYRPFKKDRKNKRPYRTLCWQEMMSQSKWNFYCWFPCFCSTKNSTPYCSRLLLEDPHLPCLIFTESVLVGNTFENYMLLYFHTAWFRAAMSDKNYKQFWVLIWCAVILRLNVVCVYGGAGLSSMKSI